MVNLQCSKNSRITYLITNENGELLNSNESKEICYKMIRDFNLLGIKDQIIYSFNCSLFYNIQRTTFNIGEDLFYHFIVLEEQNDVDNLNVEYYMDIFTGL